MTIKTTELTPEVTLIYLNDKDGEHTYLSHNDEILPLLGYDYEDEILDLHTEEYTLRLDYSF